MTDITEMQQLELDLELGQAMSRLKNNRDFKKLITKMYLEDGATLITKNLSKLKYRKDVNMDIIDDELVARSLLYKFIEDIDLNARSAAEALGEMQDELNAEDSDE